MGKAFCSSVLLVVLSVVPAITLAQETESDPCLEAKYDARQDVKSWQWIAVGCVFNLLGVGAAYLLKPTPPPDRLLGKSSDYVESYTECFMKAARKVRGGYAWIGCGAAGVASLITGLIMYVLAVQAATSCADTMTENCMENVSCTSRR
ncbi:hypothetical protein JXM67_05470 [candidate division WOR-3 bacterium]|nr:hypothetical protein [candidate division WOR-3 bacterium]